MLNHIDLLTLLFAPVIAYLAAALVFSAVQSKTGNHSLVSNSSSVHYHDGHTK